MSPHRTTIHRRLALTLVATTTLAVAATSSEFPATRSFDSPVDFDRDVRPLLSNACFECHGPDAGSREASLRLDREDGLLGEDGVVVAGDAEASLLFQRITHLDSRRVMPPPDARHQLDPAAIRLIRRWIDEGAEWRDHWAFTPAVRRPGSPTDDPDRDPIDRRILAALDSAGLEPSPSIDRPTLLRRVSFDLTGLPPTIDELDAFIADREPGAYERVVDRLLASTSYGERMATPWLDLARYADTYGYQSDVGRPTWPYRDWVIRAFNENLPHDDFITWQLAGDLLPEPTRDQRIATAFNRLHRMTNEGGSVEAEYRAEYVADRVHTFGTAMLGLTTECARCHDHKFDPISQREYYELGAFFDDIAESGLYSHFTDATPTPTLLLTTSESDAEIVDHRVSIAAHLAAIETLERDGDDRFQAWVASAPTIEEPPGLVTHLLLDALLDGGALENQVDADRPGTTAGGPRPGEDGGLRLDGENSIRAPGAEFARFDPFTIALRMRIPAMTDRAVLMHRSRAWTDAGSQGWELLLEDGRPRWSLIHFWPGDAISIRGVEPLPLDRWIDVAVVSDGSSTADGLSMFVDGERWPSDVTHDHLIKAITGGGPGPMTIGQRFRDRGFKGGEVRDLRVLDRACSPLEIRHLHDGLAISAALASPDAIEDPELRSAFHAGFDPMVRTEVKALRDTRRSLAATLDRTPELMVMEELDTPRIARILDRGRYDRPGEAVEPGVPAVLGDLPANAPRNRLGLARWATSPENPLTARVAVNRLWMQVFGTGLVPTPEDFGVQGIRPSHPALLDELTLDFIASGWDVKAMLRRLVLTATYRRSSRSNDATDRIDPDNRLLGHGPGDRLGAEMIRDHALAASGLLVDRVGGPSVFPDEPPGLWQEKSGGTYPRSLGDDLHRRSLYTYWKRTSPPPAMLLLDAAQRDVCSARRSPTATPLQALVLMNDPQFVEAARVLAERVLTETEEASTAIEAAFRRLTSRRPSEDERTVLLELHAAELAAFREDPASAAALAAIGDAPRFPGLDPIRVAAMTVTCSTILNTDAATTRR